MNSAKNIMAVYPVTPTQKGMLFYLINAEPGDINYREQLNFTVPKGTEINHLKTAWQMVVDRHPVLRSIYSWENKSQPLQAVLKQNELVWREHDLRATNQAEIDSSINAIQLSARTAPLTLNKSPAVSIDLFVLNEEADLLTFNFTHLQLDGWSMALISNEVEYILSRLKNGAEVNLPAAGEYKDYVKWFLAQDQEKSINYWHNQLQNIDTTKPLKLAHTDAYQNTSEERKNSNYRLSFDAQQHNKIVTFCQKNGLTLNAYMLGVFGLLNNQITHSHNSVIGSVVSGRPNSVNQIEHIAGFFSNALPVTVNSEGESPFSEWIKGFQQSLVTGWDHSYIGIDQIKQSLQVSVTDDLFSTLFIFQNFPRKLVDNDETSHAEESQQSLTKIAGEEQSHYPLTLYVMSGDELNVFANFDTTRYSENEISQLLERYQQLLTNCIEQADSAPHSILPLTQTQKDEIIEIGRGDTQQWSMSSLSEALELGSQVNTTKSALSFKNETWDYATLNNHIYGVCEELKTIDITAGSRVALVMNRSFEFIVASLAILRCGASYVPIDPNMPTERQKYILIDANIDLVIAEDEQAFYPRTMISSKLTTLQAQSSPIVQSSDNDEAYVIYTSGSTGMPKGVSISRGSLLNHTFSAIKEYGITSNDTGLQFSSVSFDTAVEEIYPIIFQGAHLVLRDDDILASSDSFTALINKHQINILNFPTAFWTNWITQINQQPVGLPSSVRLVIIGGEEALKSSLHLWQSYCNKHQITVKLYNTYGPTEATVVATRHDISDWVIDNKRLPIGHAIDNTACYILNSHRQVLPEGFVGELAITGRGLAKGYINNQAQTDSVFVDIEHIGRAYLTGDLGYHSQGTIYYLGRKDHQLKIRGYRIELGEIEQALASFEKLDECVVASYCDQSDTTQLAAYYSADEELTRKELREYLATKLPDYMIPQVFIHLAHIPRTITGKYDRKNLPEPTVQPLNIENLTDTYQSTLAIIWSKLLGANDIDEQSHFYHLGGHSILTVKLIGEIRDAFSVELAFNQVFNNPTLAEMAQLIKAKAQGLTAANATLPDLVHQKDLVESPLSFQQERVWFLQQLQKENTAYNFQMTFFLEGDLNITCLEQTLEEVVARQQLWFCTFHSKNGVPYQRVEKPFSIDLTPVDLSHLALEEQEAEAKRLLKNLSQTAFDITKLPLIRWKLIKLSENQYYLQQVEHHLIHDGWSVGLFLNEMQTIYEAKIKGQKHALKPLKYSYNDFCVWQREALSGDYYKEMESYWLKKLENFPTSLGLPYDYPRPQTPAFEGESMMFNLDDDLYAGLREFAKENGFTLYMTMLASYYLLLYKYSGQEDINIGAGAASRTIPELHPIIGMMVNSIVLRTDLSGDPTFLELLERVRETCLDGYTYQDMPFEKLVQELSPERMGHANPLFQTMFSFHDAEVPEPDFGDLKVRGEVNTNKSAKLDLNIIVAPHAEQRVGKKSTRKAVAVMTWEYSTDLFTHKTMQEMVTNFLSIMKAAISEPNKAISQFEVVRDETAEKFLAPAREVASEHNRYPESVPQLFDKQVNNSPDSTAVINQDGSSATYRQLQQRSISYAHALKQNGAQSGDIIGLAIGASSDLYALMIAALRLNCSYTPIDLSAGDLRLSTMINNLVTHSRQPLLIVDETIELNAQVSQLQLAQLLVQTDEQNEPFDLSTSDSPAYVMYTSGTTGHPKGAQVSQKSIIRLVNKPNFVELSNTDVWLQHSSIYFDASVLEIWAPLLNGAKLVVPSVSKLSLAQLSGMIDEYQISHLWLTAGLFHQYADFVKPQSHPSLKYLLAGGDVLSPEKVRNFLSLNAHTTLINGYGPTENTTFSYCKAMTQASLADWENAPSVPLGTAISGTRGYVLNEQGQLCAYGAIGELYLAGDGLAIGYLDKQQTEAAFVSHSFDFNNHIVTERLYKTGDMVKYNEHGELEFIGRKDNQIKLRGFRVELSEIEEVINQHELVQQACVLVKEDDANNKHLIACYLSNSDLNEELEHYCQQQLLAHQVPALFCRLDDFPLTVNGKLDRKKILQRNEFDFQAANNNYIAPETELEQLLCDIWQQTLKIERVGTNDNFFRLGGHSLSAVNVLAQISDHLSVNIHLADMFTSPTVKGLITLIENHANNPVASSESTDIEVNETLTEDLSDEELDALLASMEEDE